MCVTGSSNQFNLTTHALSEKQKQSLIEQRDGAVGKRSSLSNQRQQQQINR